MEESLISERRSALDKQAAALGEAMVLMVQQGKTLQEAVAQQGKSLEEAITRQGERFSEGMKELKQELKEAIVLQTAAIKEAVTSNNGATATGEVSTGLKVNQATHAGFQAVLRQIFEQKAVHKTGIQVNYSCLVNGSPCSDISSVHDRLVGDQAVATTEPYALMNISPLDAQSQKDISDAFADAVSNITPSSEWAGQKSLAALAESHQLKHARDTSTSRKQDKFPFFLWKEKGSSDGIRDIYATDSGMPDMASAVSPMLLEIKGSSLENQYHLLQQALLRAHSMIQYNCLLKEVVCFASTFKQNWALRVTKNIVERGDLDGKVTLTYLFDFICLPSAGFIGECWNILSDPSKAPSQRFFEPDWFRIQWAMQELGTPANFLGYHKVSWEACSGSNVYTIHKSVHSTEQGVGKVNRSSSNQPLCTVKVNCSDPERAQQEYRVVQKLLDRSRPSAYQALFHVIGCSYFACGMEKQLAVNVGTAINRKARRLLDDNEEYLKTLTQDSPWWWNFNKKTCIASILLCGRSAFTVTVMRSGVPLEDVRCADELGCSKLVSYPRTRLLLWMTEFLHPAGILHSDCRRPNLMVFKYDEDEVNKLAEQFKQSTCCQKLVEHDGMYVDVQLIDFDLSCLCADEAEAKAGALVAVSAGAQKSKMIRTLLLCLSTRPDDLENTNALHWSTEHDKRMLVSTLNDMTQDPKASISSRTKYLLSRLGVKSSALVVSTTNDHLNLMRHAEDVSTPLVVSLKTADSLVASPSLGRSQNITIVKSGKNRASRPPSPAALGQQRTFSTAKGASKKKEAPAALYFRGTTTTASDRQLKLLDTGKTAAHPHATSSTPAAKDKRDLSSHSSSAASGYEPRRLVYKNTKRRSCVPDHQQPKATSTKGTSKKK